MAGRGSHVGAGSKAIFIAALLLGVPAWAALQSAGKVTGTTVSSDQVDFQLETGGVARVQMLDSDLVLTRVNSKGMLQTSSTGATSPSGLSAPHSTITDTTNATYL